MQFIRKLFGLKPPVNFSELVQNKAIIIDVRTVAEFKSGCIKKSVNIPVNDLPKKLNKLKDKNQPIITCCASGIRSAMARQLLQSNGFKNVYNGGSWHRLQRKINN